MLLKLDPDCFFLTLLFLKSNEIVVLSAANKRLFSLIEDHDLLWTLLLQNELNISRNENQYPPLHPLNDGFTKKQLFYHWRYI